MLALNVILSHFLVRPSITINKRMRLSCINVPQIYFTSYSLVTGCVWLSSAFIGDRKKWTNWIERRVKYEIYVLAKEVSGERVEHTIMMVSILYMTANMPNKNAREKKESAYQDRNSITPPAPPWHAIAPFFRYFFFKWIFFSSE